MSTVDPKRTSEPFEAAAAQRAAPGAAVWSALVIYTGVPFLGLLCLVWSLIALPAGLLLPERLGTTVGRWGISRGFRLYIEVLRIVGAYHFDTRALERIKGERGVIIAPNHPSLLDALLLLAYHPNMVCIMKNSLMHNLFLGAGARLARFIGNTPPRRMIIEAVAALRGGAVVLLFPEGTRSRVDPVNEFQLTVGAIAKHAGAEVLPVLIDTDCAYLGKGWTLFHVPRLPILYHVRLGRRFAPPTDVREFTRQFEGYFEAELRHSHLGKWLPRGHPAPRN